MSMGNRVREMSLQGYTAAAIAKDTGLKLASVYVYRSTLGVSQKRAPRDNRPGSITVHLPKDVVDELAAEAGKRGIPSSALARLILTTVVDDEMLKAVLDD